MSTEIQFKLRDKGVPADERRFAEQIARAVAPSAEAVARMVNAARLFGLALAQLCEITVPPLFPAGAWQGSLARDCAAIEAAAQTFARDLDLRVESFVSAAVEAARSMPEEEREEWRRAAEDAPLEEVDVNASGAGPM